MYKRQNLLLVELEFVLFPIAMQPQLQFTQRIRSQNVDFLEMGLRDLAFDLASLILNIEIIHPILTKIETNLDRN